MRRKLSKRFRFIRFIILCIVFTTMVLLVGKWTIVSGKEYIDETREEIEGKENIIDKEDKPNKDKENKINTSENNNTENIKPNDKIDESNMDIEDNNSEDKINEKPYENDEIEPSEEKSDSSIISVPVEEAYLNDGRKIVFLTFDDGPSKNTIEILKILDEKDVKATFFVLGQLAEKNPEIIKEINNKGHSIGNHSYTHNYRKIYSNVNNLLEEINKTKNILNDILGEEYNSSLFRFPGGSFGNKKSSFRTAVVNNGYDYIDWNSLNRDSEGINKGSIELLQNVKDTVKGKERAVILMHDSATKASTVDALPETIDYLRNEGYEFGILE